MWYLIFAVSVYISVYTFSYGMFEWRKTNKSAAVAVWFLCAWAFVVPLIKIFV